MSLLAFLSETPKAYPMLGEKVACAAVSPQLYIQVQCFSPLGHRHFDFGDFSNGVCRVMKITTAESNPGMVLFHTNILLLLQYSLS